MMSRVICLVGIDGVGKSTVANMLSDAFRSSGKEARVVWLRYNHLLSKPILLLGRIFGLTRYETIRSLRVGYHYFYKSRFVSYAFIFFQYLDAVRVKYTTIRRMRNCSEVVILTDSYMTSWWTFT